MNRHSSSHASALLIVFWAVVIMSICVLGVVSYLHTCLDETTALRKDSRARQLAESGIAVAMNPAVSRGDPALHGTVAPGESFDVRLQSEGGRLNINNVLRGQQWVVLQNLFDEWGVQATDIANVMQGFAARVTDPANPTKPAGPANPAAKPGQAQPGVPLVVKIFPTIDDMLSVPGMKAVAAAKPDWRDYFTIWSDGPVDLNQAPADLIAAVTGVGMARAEQFVGVRNGTDGLPGTEDDVVFTDLDQARALLGMSTDAFSSIQGMVSIKDSTARIESTGALGGFRRKVTAVVRRNGGPPTLLLWQEL